MNYLDKDGNYSKENVINSILDIDDEIQDEYTKEVVDKEKITRLRYEQMLRGLYLWQNPFDNY